MSGDEFVGVIFLFSFQIYFADRCFSKREFLLEEVLFIVFKLIGLMFIL